ncbi:unnamed protein product, partial [Staurois parvus]
MGPYTASSCCCQVQKCVMGPRTDSKCCCQARNLSWAPVPPPHAAARSRLCHGSLYGRSHCCCQACNLPWAPVPTPHAAARPVICHGPLYRLLMLLPGPECVMGPCIRPPIAAVSIATLCHVPLSGLLTLLVGFHFCHRVLYGLPLLLPPPPHCGSTLWFWPRVTGQMSEVCTVIDSKIDGTHLHVILPDSIISLPQQTPRAFKLKVQCSALIL